MKWAECYIKYNNISVDLKLQKSYCILFRNDLHVRKSSRNTVRSIYHIHDSGSFREVWERQECRLRDLYL